MESAQLDGQPRRMGVERDSQGRMGKKMSGSPIENRITLPVDAKSIAEVLPLLLRKIVRLLVGTISFPALVEMLRSVYVEEGQKKLERSGSKPTKSALALITGMDTRVVSTVLANNCDTSLEPQQVSPEFTLIDMWNSDPFFQDHETGRAATLPVEGRGKTFQGLVLRSIGRNITVKTVLDRLLKSKTIELEEGDIQQVRLLTLEYTPISNDKAKLTDITFLEASRVMSAGIHNMNSPPDERVPQQGRWTYRLSPSKYKALRKEARTLLQKQIKEGEALLEQFEEPNKEPGQLTVGIGWYQWGDHEIETLGE
jgi:hypothetical protein